MLPAGRIDIAWQRHVVPASEWGHLPINDRERNASRTVANRSRQKQLKWKPGRAARRRPVRSRYT